MKFKKALDEVLCGLAPEFREGADQKKRGVCKTSEGYVLLMLLHCHRGILKRLKLGVKNQLSWLKMIIRKREHNLIIFIHEV